MQDQSQISRSTMKHAWTHLRMGGRESKIGLDSAQPDRSILQRHTPTTDKVVSSIQSQATKSMKGSEILVSKLMESSRRRPCKIMLVSSQFWTKHTIMIYFTRKGSKRKTTTGLVSSPVKPFTIILIVRTQSTSSTSREWMLTKSLGRHFKKM